MLFQREKLIRIRTSRGKMSSPPKDDTVFDFSGERTPKIPRGPTKPFAELTRQGKDYRSKELLGRIYKAIDEVRFYFKKYYLFIDTYLITKDSFIGKSRPLLL